MSNVQKTRKKWNGLSEKTRRLTLTALLVAVELMMWLLGLGQVPVGALNMSFLTVPVAVGAILFGPSMGAVLGCTFGLTSLFDAMTGRSALTSFFFTHHPVHTVLLCVGMRVLMGVCTGLVFRALRGRPPVRIWKYFASAICAPLLNTLFFMGYICLFLYQTEMVQNLVAKTGALNPFMFVILLVGVQGLVEAAVCCFIGGAVSRGVAKAVFKE